MKKIALIYACLTCLVTSCSRAGVVIRERHTIASPSVEDKAHTLEPSQLNAPQKQIAEISAVAKGRVGVSAIVLETGETVASLNAQDHFPMQSVYKLPISMAVMKQVDAGKIKLEQRVRVTADD